MADEVEKRALMRIPAVHEGAGISVVAPASPAKQERIEGGAERLRQLGYMPKFAENALVRGPLFFAGTPEERIADLHAAFTAPDSLVVMSLRGGYGSNHLLDGIDFELIASRPKPFFAYSDLTGLQLHLLDEFGIPAFHGPMLAADFYLQDGVHLPSFHAALEGRSYKVGAEEGLRAIQPGVARGTLYGGCLSILTAMLGTPWEPQTEGKLLFLEDTGAKPYQVDRMLWQLREAGKLEDVSGIVFGEMLDCTSPGADPGLLEQVVRRFFADFEGPIAYGLRSGHVSRDNVTLTFGVEAELKVGEGAEMEVGSRD